MSKKRSNGGKERDDTMKMAAEVAAGIRELPIEWPSEADEAAIEKESVERRRRLVGHEQFVARVSALLFEEDPAGVNYEEHR